LGAYFCINILFCKGIFGGSTKGFFSYKNKSSFNTNFIADLSYGGKVNLCVPPKPLESFILLFV